MRKLRAETPVRLTMLCPLVLAAVLARTAAAQPLGRYEPVSCDIAIYGGTSSGVAAAVQAARMGKSVIVIEPGRHLGGLTASGLGWTDSGNKAVVGGISREFYRRLKRHYDEPAAWKHERPSEYDRYRADDDAMWTFEPHIAERLFEEWLAEHKVPVVRGERLDRSAGLAMTRSLPPRIISIRMESGRVYQARMFIDATYEGDLMAAAGVSYTVGREPSSQYDESLGGVQRAQNVHSHRFVKDVDPYVEPGEPASGLLPGIDPGPYPPDGAGDHRLQAYCYRMCMSNVPENRVPFPKPADYNELDYELLLRNFEAGDLRLPLKPDMMPNGKTDTNNNCAVSTDFIGQNYAYPEASYEERDRILREHTRYQKGLMWTLANHPRVPLEIRERMSQWGLAKDEFVATGHWPHQIYVREARRLVGAYVMTENDCRRLRPTPMSIGMGSYNMDSHNCMRYVTADGYVQNEGDVQVSPGGPYQISYLSIVPKRDQAANLLVPVCISSSHIAYGSVRMEPVFMVLGQSAATAAALAIDDAVTVQELSYDKLRERLLRDGQVLEFARPERRSAARTPRRAPEPTKHNVPYGPDERHVLDFWRADSRAPAPLAVYIHGGGFRGGSKESLSSDTLGALLAARISVAAIHYRLVPSAPLPAAHHDARRALKFLRSRAAEWNIDKRRIGAFGGSARPALAMYLAFHAEMAEPQSPDPVARESSRLTCVATSGGQTTMDFDWWLERVPGYDTVHRSVSETFGVESIEASMKVVRQISALSLISGDDPPIFMSYGMAPDAPVPADAELAQGWKVHHVIFGIELKKKMDALGIECDLEYPGARTTYRSAAHFLIDKLRGAAPPGTPSN